MGEPVLATLPPSDVESLLSVWPRSLTCPVWRLRGESPSPGLFDEIRSGADDAMVLRDDDRAVGLLEVREVDRITRSGYLGVLLPPVGGLTALVQQFLAASLARLDLRRITVVLDADVLDVLADAPLGLDRTGLLRDHTLAGRGRYVDRHVFEFTGEAD